MQILPSSWIWNAEGHGQDVSSTSSPSKETRNSHVRDCCRPESHESDKTPCPAMEGHPEPVRASEEEIRSKSGSAKAKTCSSECTHGRRSTLSRIALAPALCSAGSARRWSKVILKRRGLVVGAEVRKGSRGVCARLQLRVGGRGMQRTNLYEEKRGQASESRLIQRRPDKEVSAWSQLGAPRPS